MYISMTMLTLGLLTAKLWLCLNSLICSCDPKTCIHAHRSPNCLKLEFRVLHLLCLETVIWHQRLDSWHYVDLKTSQSCAQGVHECPSQPKLNRQTALQPHAPFWPYSVLFIITLIPNTTSRGFTAHCWTLFSLVSSPAKGEKNPAELKGECPDTSASPSWQL